MKIVQSFWSCNQNNLLQFHGGWYAPEYHLMGWALSCLQLKQCYKDVTLFADDISAKMLIDELKLPYTDVVCELDNLNHYHPRLWALPKIYTYSRQNKPFLHVDGDVFIWKPFDDGLLKGSLIAQNLEVATNHYEGIMRSLEAKIKFLPEEIISERKTNNLIYAYNAGIFGGSDIAFFNLYTQKAKAFIDKNVSSFSKINVDAFNIFFEQYLFYCLAKKEHKSVNVLTNDIIRDNEYTGFGDFMEIPYNKQYLHLIGTYKRNKSVCEQMADRLRLDHPEYYYRIIALFKNKQVPLKRDYYYFIDEYAEQALSTRYRKLKTDYQNNKIILKDKYNKDSLKSALITMTRLVENTIDEIQNKLADEYKYYVDQLKDVKLFEHQLRLTLDEKFPHYSKEYLYARDIAHTRYFQDVFENKDLGFNKKIVTDTIFEVVENKFDWTEIHFEEQGKSKLIEQLSALPSKFYTAIVPECDTIGYSLVAVDDLDMMILKMLENPATINEVLNKARDAFDQAELEESQLEFEMLMIGRIKMALNTKLIKLI